MTKTTLATIIRLLLYALLGASLSYFGHHAMSVSFWVIMTITIAIGSLSYLEGYRK